MTARTAAKTVKKKEEEKFLGLHKNLSEHDRSRSLQNPQANALSNEKASDIR